MNIFETYSGKHIDGLYRDEAETLKDTVEESLDRMTSVIEMMQLRGEEYCSMCRELFYKLHDIVLDEYDMSRQELENIERVLMDIEVF